MERKPSSIKRFGNSHNPREQTRSVQMNRVVRPRRSKAEVRSSQTSTSRAMFLPPLNSNKQFLHSLMNAEMPPQYKLNHNPLLNHHSPTTNAKQTSDTNANNSGTYFGFSFQMNQSSADNGPRSLRSTTSLAKCGSRSLTDSLSDPWTAIFLIMRPSWRLQSSSSAFCLLEIRGKCFECLRALSYWGLVKTAIASRTDLRTIWKRGWTRMAQIVALVLRGTKTAIVLEKATKGSLFGRRHVRCSERTTVDPHTPDLHVAQKEISFSTSHKNVRGRQRRARAWRMSTKRRRRWH